MMTLYMPPNSHEKTQYNTHLLKTNHFSAHVLSHRQYKRLYIYIKNRVGLLFFKWYQGKKIEIQDRKKDRKYKLLLITSLITISTVNGEYKKISHSVNKKCHSDYGTPLCPET